MKVNRTIQILNDEYDALKLNFSYCTDGCIKILVLSKFHRMIQIIINGVMWCFCIMTWQSHLVCWYVWHVYLGHDLCQWVHNTILNVLYNTAVVLLMAISHNDICILEEISVSDWSPQDIFHPYTMWWSHCVFGQSTCLSEVQWWKLVSVAFILHHDAHVPIHKTYGLI